MPDTRTVAHEFQEQLVAAMHRGHEQLRKSQQQLRKSQQQLRKSQQQLRKGREAVNGAIRTGNEFAKSVRPNIPALPGKGLHLPPLGTLTSPAKLRAHAQEIAGRVAATQRNLADKALHVAGPLVVDGVARLNQAAKSFLEEHEREHAAVEAGPDSQAKPDADAVQPAATKAATSKAATAEAGTAKAGTAEAGTAKAGTAKAGTAKAGTGKAAAKARTSKAADGKTSTAKAKS